MYSIPTISNPNYFRIKYIVLDSNPPKLDLIPQSPRIPVRQPKRCHGVLQLLEEIRSLPLPLSFFLSPLWLSPISLFLSFWSLYRESIGQEEEWLWASACLHLSEDSLWAPARRLHTSEAIVECLLSIIGAVYRFWLGPCLSRPHTRKGRGARRMEGIQGARGSEWRSMVIKWPNQALS